MSDGVAPSAVGTTADPNECLIARLRRLEVIRSASVERAFRRVRREWFLPTCEADHAYEDVSVVIKSDDRLVLSSSSQPALMAAVLEQAHLQAGHHVLEIGAGAGYNAALLADIVGDTGRVTTVDIDGDLVENAARNLEQAGFGQVAVVHGDGAFGCERNAPYDRIVVTVASGDLWPAWRDQLKPGGLLVVPLCLRGPQVSVSFANQSEYLESGSIHSCHYIPLRGDHSIPTTYVPAGGGTYTLVFRGEGRDVICDLEGALRQPAASIHTGISATLTEMSLSLTWWLALRNAGYCSVRVNTAAAARALGSLVEKLGRTIGIVSGQAIYLLSAEPTSAVEGSAEIVIVAFGDSEARDILSQVREWDRSGRPDVRSYHIRAFETSGKAPTRRAPVMIDTGRTRFEVWHSGVTV